MQPGSFNWKYWIQFVFMIVVWKKRFETPTYIGVYRDPRDAFFSMRNHADNMKMETGAKRQEMVDEFRECVETDINPGDLEYSLGFPVHHLKCLWDLRHLPNVHLFHYSDLLRNLKGEMRRVAKTIGVNVGGTLLSEFAEAATFSNMRANFDKFVPGTKGDFWHEPKAFLKKGTRGQWQGVLPPELLERFDLKLKELAGDEMAEWIVGGNGRA